MNTTVFFDLLGTLIHHETKQALPMIPFMLKGLSKQGCQIAILTSYDYDTAKALSRDAGLPPLKIFAGGERASLVRQAFEYFHEPEMAWYFDDKPDGLSSIRQLGLRSLEGRVLGFLGSRKYCNSKKYSPTLPAWCKANRVPLALSPFDLTQVLEADEIYEEFCLLHREPPRLSPDEVAFIFPGVLNPCSVFGDGRAVNDLMDAPQGQWEPVWKNLGWVGTEVSIWSYMIISAAKDYGLTSVPTPGTDVERISEYARQNRRVLCELLKRILAIMEKGIDDLGRDAESCRPAGFGFDSDRRQVIDAIVVRLAGLCD